ncbi:MAG: type II CAAX endopeptidase family protein [Cyanobacteria bacterium P01_D01_bin.36]
MNTMLRRRRSAIALLASVPFMSVGVVAFLLFPSGTAGQIILALCQLWLLSVPVVWLCQVERGPFQVSKPKRVDFVMGGIVGLLMFFIILAAYELLLKHWIDSSSVQDVLAQVGGFTPVTFWLGGIYFSFVNALIEEYFWRWFVFSRCEELLPTKAAVAVSALFFTLHHTIGLAAFAVGWRVVVVGSLAVFVAGVVWSVTYQQFRSVWGSYVSHAIADIALHIVAWQVFFR